MFFNIQAQFEGFLKTRDIFSEKTQTPFPRFDFPALKMTDGIKADLEKLHHPRNSVLGKRMESFFEIAVKHSSRYRIIASNLQIIDEKQTLGEIDFLLYDELRSRPLHVELVYKLYIYDPEFPSEMEKWIGPNRRDSFAAKLEKLKSGQFPLLYRSETLKYLENKGLRSEEIEQQLCFKAKLFTPAEIDINQTRLVNPGCCTGKWFRYSEFRAQSWENNLFMSPDKKHWSANPGAGRKWLTYPEIIRNINALFERKKSPLIWMKTPEGYKSFFVVWW